MKSEITQLVQESKVAESMRAKLLSELEPIKREIEDTIDKSSKLYALTTAYWNSPTDVNKDVLLTFVASEVEAIKNV